MDKAQQDALKKAAGIEAAKLIQNGMIAGLGTGSTVRFLVDELGPRSLWRSARLPSMRRGREISSVCRTTVRSKSAIR